MADNPLTKIPPKRLALIGGGGVAAGIVWRMVAKRSAPVSSPTVPATSTDVTTGLPTSGNQGVGESSNRRDIVDSSITLPVAEWVIAGQDGIKYLTDGYSIKPFGTTRPSIVEAWSGESQGVLNPGVNNQSATGEPYPFLEPYPGYDAAKLASMNNQ